MNQGTEKQSIRSEEIQGDNEIPMQESIDKLTVQIALVVVGYLLAYLIMRLLGRFLPGMRSVIFGFNFLLGVLSAALIKGLINRLTKAGVMKKKHIKAR